MGFDDKVQNEGEDTLGKAKEGFGKATGNESLEAEGKGDQVSAKAKKMGENFKDAAGKAGDKVKDMFNKDK